MTYVTEMDSFIELLQAQCQSLVPSTVKRLYYGDTKLIPDFPAVLFIPGAKDRPPELGQTHFFKLLLTCQVVVIHEAIGSIEVTEQTVTQRAETVETALMSDLELGHNIIFGYVTRMAPVTVLREKVVHRAHQLTFTGESRQFF